MEFFADYYTEPISFRYGWNNSLRYDIVDFDERWGSLWNSILLSLFRFNKLYLRLSFQFAFWDGTGHV